MTEKVEAKGALQSTTVIGAAAVLAVMGLRALGIKEIQESDVIQVIQSVVQIAGIVAVFLGRRRATGPIRGLIGRKLIDLKK